MSVVHDVETGLATRILEMTDDDLDTFMRTCVRDRNLHKVVGDLNRQCLRGEPSTRRTAEKALSHLGFVPY